MIPVARPEMGEAELEQVREAIESGWIGLGPKVDEFEERFAEQFGHDRVVATSACTHALDLALKAADLDGNEVLVPPITWVSTAHVARYNGLDVGWVDVDEETLCLDPDALRDRIGEDTAAVVPVHYGGQPADLDPIVEVAHEHDAVVVEDCAHAPGVEYRGESVGSIGDIGCFSFQATKPLSTGEGGAFVTDDDALADRARRLSKLGVDKSTHERDDDDGYSWYYEVTHTGYKYFMHDISAGIGLAQLDRLDGMLERRNAVADAYREGFADLEWVQPLADRDDSTHAYYNFTVRVPPADREPLIEHLDERDVGATVHYMPLYKHPVFDDHEPDLPTTERVWEEIVTLPMSSTFDAEDAATVVEAVRSYWA